MMPVNKTWVWLALLLTPLIALVNFSTIYSFIFPACEQQSDIALLVFSIGSLGFSLALTFLAWNYWQQHDILEDAPVKKSFIPALASIVGLLSTLFIAAQWIPQWILSPCFA